MSLRRRWNRSLAILVASVAGATIVGILVARTTTNSFESTARSADRSTTALTELRDEMMAAAAAEHSEQATADELRSARDATGRSFDAAESAAPSSEARDLVRQARQLWESPSHWQAAPSSAATTDAASATASVEPIAELLDRAGSEGRRAIRDELADAARTRNVLLGAMVLAGLVSVGASFRLARRLSRAVLGPIGDLRVSTARLRDGDFSHRAAVSRQDELGELAAGFNSMADAIDDMKRTLVEQATTDSLTGLANRHAFDAVVTAARDRSDRPDGVLFVDLDDFKGVNDRLGHAGGDELLKAAAARIATVVRPGDFVARLGGDEFAVLLEDGTAEALAAVGDRVVAALADPIEIMGQQIQVSASVGVAFRRPGADLETITREADVAMYAAKQRGKNRLQRFDSSAITGGLHAR